MEYQTIQEKLAEIFSCTALDQTERDILMLCYLNPGIEVCQIKKALSNPKRAIEQLLKKGLLLKTKVSGRYTVYPIPLVLMLKKCADKDAKCGEECMSVLESIDQWIKYPVLRSTNARIKTSNNTDTVIKWLFDLHSTDWEKVYCFGDYESFIESIGIDTETEWIRERINKSRKASVVATQDGRWARKIQSSCKRELRDCLIDPKDFSSLFIMAFPDINTTVLGGANGKITFVHSSTIANNYTSLVEKNLIAR